MDLLLVAVIILDFFIIRDIMGKLTGEVERFLWIICVVFVPVLGAAFWIHVQYGAPRRKRIKREERERLKKR